MCMEGAVCVQFFHFDLTEAGEGSAAAGSAARCLALSAQRKTGLKAFCLPPPQKAMKL